MNLLVTGARGFIGQSLVTALFAHDCKVRAAVRSSVDEGNIEQVLIGSIDEKTNWSAALLNINVVIHLAAKVHVMRGKAADSIAEFRKVNVEGTLNLAKQSANAGVRRFVFISSIGVNGAQTIMPFTELDTPSPHNAYALSKLEAEQGLQKISQETGLEVVIIRPPLVYGKNAPGNFSSMIRAIRCEIPLPFGAIHNKRSFVYVDNLVSLLLRCVDHPAAANQVFLVSDGHDLSTTELLQDCAVALGVKARLLAIPQRLLEVAATLLGKKAVAQRLCGNLQVDITKARTLLGWEPPFSVEQGLNAMAKSL